MTKQRRRRSTRILDDLPGLFDAIEIDFSRADIAGDIISAHQAGPLSPSEESDRGFELDTDKLRRPESIKFISFGSGSSGNCAYIGDSESGVLIDAGVDNRHVTDELKRNGIDIRSIRGIIITHDHSDHVRYAYQLLRRNPHMLLYCTPKTLGGILRRHNISRRIKDSHKPVFKEFPFTVGNFTVTAFDVSHDGTDNAGFCISHGERNFVIATDMGIISERADHYMRQADYLMIESNYDHQMLMQGKYPEYLKFRIASERGHLDNMTTAEYLGGMWTPRLSHIFLCHLSHDNNTPEIALGASRKALEAKGIAVGDGTDGLATRKAPVQLVALPRFESSPLYILRDGK